MKLPRINWEDIHKRKNASSDCFMVRDLTRLFTVFVMILFGRLIHIWSEFAVAAYLFRPGCLLCGKSNMAISENESLDIGFSRFEYSLSIRR